MALITRGNEKLAEELLGRQSEILLTLYGDGTEEETLEPSMDAKDKPSETADTDADADTESKDEQTTEDKSSTEDTEEE